MKQILIYCVMQRENPQDAIALAESPRDEFVVVLYFLPRTEQPRTDNAVIWCEYCAGVVLEQ